MCSCLEDFHFPCFPHRLTATPLSQPVNFPILFHSAPISPDHLPPCHQPYKLNLCSQPLPFTQRHKEPECCCMCSSCVRYLNNKPHTHTQTSMPHTHSLTHQHTTHTHTHTHTKHTHLNHLSKAPW